MFEEFWPDIGRVVAAGFLASIASATIQWASRHAARKARERGRASLERRLAAILIADVVGYSRLMSLDEEDTHNRLLTYRREILEPKIREHRGRLIKTTGDGALVEFVSAVNAVRCALDVQQAIRTRNADLPESRRIDLRMAVNLGDIIVAPDDIYGHAVNVVARLESLAAPGSVCMSEDIWRHVRGTINAGFVDLGEHQLKNIADPVRVFAVSPNLRSVDKAPSASAMHFR